MNTESIGYADDAAVSRMKQENPGGVFFIETNGHIAYFREPTRHDVNAALAVSDPERPLAVAEKFGQLLFLQGSKAVLAQDALFLGASIALRQKMNGVTAYMGNL
jgi:hypothetical protein